MSFLHLRKRLLPFRRGAGDATPTPNQVGEDTRLLPMVTSSRNRDHTQFAFRYNCVVWLALSFSEDILMSSSQTSSIRRQLRITVLCLLPLIFVPLLCSCVPSVPQSLSSNTTLASPAKRRPSVAATARKLHTAEGPTVVFRGEQELKSITYSPDGQLIAAGGQTTTHVWSTSKRETIATLRGHRPLRSVAFSEDGMTLYTIDESGDLIFWSMEDFREKRRLRLGTTQGWGSVFAIAPNGKYACKANLHERVYTVWRLPSGDMQNQGSFPTEGGRHSESAALSPDGSLLALAGGSILMVNTTSGELDFIRGASRPFRAVQFSGDGRFLAVSGDNVPLIDLKQRVQVGVATAGDRWVRSIAFHPKSSELALGFGEGKMRVVQSGLGEEVQFLDDGLGLRIQSFDEIQREEIAQLLQRATNALENQDLRSAERHAQYVLKKREDDKDALAILEEAGQRIDAAKWHRGEVSAVSLSPDGAYVASGASDHGVKIWDVETRNVKFDFVGHNDWVRSVAFDEAGERLFSASQDGVVHCWDLKSGEALGRIQEIPVRRRSHVAISPDGRYFAGIDDGTYEIWDLSSRERTRHGKAAVSHTESMAVSPSGKSIAFASGTVTLQEFEPERVRQHRARGGHYRAVEFSRDGQLLAVSSGDVELLDVNTLEESYRVKPQARWVRSIHVARALERIVVGVDDGLIQLSQYPAPNVWTTFGSP